MSQPEFDALATPEKKIKNPYSCSVCGVFSDHSKRIHVSALQNLMSMDESALSIHLCRSRRFDSSADTCRLSLPGYLKKSVISRLFARTDIKIGTKDADPLLGPPVPGREARGGDVRLSDVQRVLQSVGPRFLCFLFSVSA